MIRASQIMILCLLAGGCSVATLDARQLPVRMTIVQRHTEFVPGSRKSVRISIDDITGDQVLLKIYGRGNKPIVRTRSVKVGDVIPFDIGPNRYALSVRELRNFLVGDDFGVFEIAAKPPKSAPPEAAKAP